MAYLVEAATVESTLQALDHREKNGYQRHQVTLQFNRRSTDSASTAATCTSRGLVYIAAVDNHAYLGPAPLADMVKQIRSCTGPSGRNVDYLLELADALRALQADDPHVFELETAVKALNR